jgi:hypothetical protein
MLNPTKNHDRRTSQLSSFPLVVTLKALFACALNVMAMIGIVGIPGCGQGEETHNSSETLGIPSKVIHTADIPPPKTSTELTQFKKALIEGFSANSRQSIASNGRQNLKETLASAILAANGIPRQQIKEVLADAVRPSSTLCAGTSCSRVFGVNETEIDQFLDDFESEISKSKSFDTADQQPKRKQLLSSLRRETDEFFDGPCYPG